MSSSKSASTVTVSSADMAALLRQLAALTERIDRLVDAKPAAAAAPAAAEVPVKGKRGRKPRAEKEPKEKPLPPPAADGTIRFGSASEGDYKEFSAFFKAPFSVAGKDYISLANFFNSQKFADSDDVFAEEIRTQKNPALTRAKASSVKDHPPRADWETAKLDVMRTGLLAKFSAHSALKRKLLATGEAPIQSTIEEEMRIKGFWSIGEDGNGANHMGALLASVRETLRATAGDDSDEDEAPAPAAKPKAVPKPAAKPAAKPVAKPAAKPAATADSDSEEDDSDEEEEAPKPAAKPTAAAPKPVAKPAPAAPKPVAKPVVAEDSDEDEDSEDEE